MEHEFAQPSHIYADKGSYKQNKYDKRVKGKVTSLKHLDDDVVLRAPKPKRGAQGPQQPPMFGKRMPGFLPRQYIILSDVYDYSSTCHNMSKEQFLRLFHLVFAHRLLVAKSQKISALISAVEIMDAFVAAEKRGFLFKSVDFKNASHGTKANVARIREQFVPDPDAKPEPSPEPVRRTIVIRKQKPVNIHYVSPEENGSHGEVTGWDDVDRDVATLVRYPFCGKLSCRSCLHECAECCDDASQCDDCMNYSQRRGHMGGPCTAMRGGLSFRYTACGVGHCTSCQLYCTMCGVYQCPTCRSLSVGQVGVCTTIPDVEEENENGWESAGNLPPGWVTIPSDISISPDPVVASSLNGTHGEATNSDDVDRLDGLLAQMQGVAQFDNEVIFGRERREARNHQQRRPHANRNNEPRQRRPRGPEDLFAVLPNPPRGPPPNRPPPVVERPPRPPRGPPPNPPLPVVEMPPLVVIDEVPLDTCYVTPGGGLPPLYYFEEGRRYVVDPPGLVVPDGIVMRCVVNKPGFIVVKGNHGADLLTRACVSIVSIPTYEFGGKCYPAYSAPILVMLALELRKTHGPMVPSEQSLRTITASAVKHIAESSLEGLHILMRNTIEYFVMAAQWGLAAGRTQRVAFFMPHLDFSRMDTQRNNLIARGIYRAIHEDCDDMEYEMRSDQVIRVIRGDVIIERTGHPNFPRNGQVSYNTVFCRISGVDQDFFRIYSADDCNIRSAGKRIFGKREGEEQLRHNSRATYRALKDAFSGRQFSVLPLPQWSKSLSSSVAFMHKMYPHIVVMPANGDDPLPVEDYDLPGSVINLLSKMIMRLLSRCDGNYLDFLNVLARSAYYNIIIAKERLLEPLFSRTSCSLIPHAKKQLRVCIVNRQQFAGVATQLATPEAKIKKDELAKPGKAARLFVTYGDGAMQQNEIPEIVKVILNGEHDFRLSYKDEDVYCRIFVFSKPAPGDLDQVLEIVCDNLIVRNFMISLIFSDDCCVIASKDGFLTMCNVDISSNDAGKDMMQFGMIHALTTAIHPDSADVLVEAFMLPVVVNSSTRGGPRIAITGAPFMGSGHVYTTIMNHCDSLAIQTATFGYFFSSPDVTLNMAVNLGGAAVGQLLTCENCVSLEHLQFIKHSPTRLEGGKYVFLPNVSALMKSFISVRGDLEAKHLGLPVQTFRFLTDAQRFDMLGYQRVQSWCHYPSGRIIDAFRARFPPVTVSALDVVEHLPHTDNSTSYVDEASFNARYDLSDSEVDVLVADILSLAVGDELISTAVAKIYSADYTLPIHLREF